jgi:AraC-like DNA-binding protein
MSASRGSDDRRFTSSPVVRCPSLAAEAEAPVAEVRAREGPVSQEPRLRRLSELLAPLWTREARRAEPPLVARAHRALIETPSAVVSLDELAQRLGCAPTYLCQVFSHHVGLGPHAHQLQHRLLVARRLLERGETVATTAVLTGFGDESPLGRYFHRRFAAGPGRYRQGLSITDEPSR